MTGYKTEEYKPQYTTLGIAAAGVYATSPNPFGDTATRITIYDRRLSPYFGDLVEGGVVIDKRPCLDHPQFVHMVVSGPMLKECIPSGCMEAREFSYPRQYVPALPHPELGGFDFVALDVYMAIWRNMGVRIGTRHGDRILWEDNTISPIPEGKDRFFASD